MDTIYREFETTVGIHGERYFAVGTLAAAGCSCSCPMFRQMVDSAPENYAVFEVRTSGVLFLFCAAC